MLNLRPDSFVQGGLVDDIDAEVSDIKFVTWDYNGTQSAVPALGVTLKDSEGKEHDQYYSAGDLAKIQPTEDGKSLEPAEGSTTTALTNSCNTALFLKSLVDNGFPPDKLEAGDITIVKGLKAHFLRSAAPERKGLIKREGQRESTTLLVSKIHSMPWENKGLPTAGKATATTPAGKPAATAAKPAAPAASTAEFDAELQPIVFEILTEKGSAIKKSELAQLVFKKVPATNKARNQMMTRAFKDDFLAGGAEAGFWDFDGSQITPKA